jgi:hypothetical protein
MEPTGHAEGSVNKAVEHRAGEVHGRREEAREKRKVQVALVFS